MKYRARSTKGCPPSAGTRDGDLTRHREPFRSQVGAHKSVPQPNTPAETIPYPICPDAARVTAEKVIPVATPYKMWADRSFSRVRRS